ncbi:putative translation initiation factor SUI1 [Plasmodium gaboni]|uniref:Putative translation initiation factor SUI1 n=1 Tax=Plasmodium gaboni TaxID=647221 RepID=A0A151LNC7_9APIC|nr:putative translation initiation factor SUI1 [Plasmodium gaboni]KYO00730.1 putative translation initiation factor SUI1 [Plasmodium gaboni]SOV13436.1 translation initiation factor SUI1, putative [Plasmodium gaboni]
MEELEKEFDKIKIKCDIEESDEKKNEQQSVEDEEEYDEEDDSEEQKKKEKISQKKLRYLKMKDKKEEKKKKKQNSKLNNKNEDESSKKKDDDINNKEHDVNNDNNNNNDDVCLKDDKHDKYEPVIVEYCKVCGMPYEYCEYGNSFNECKEENKDKYNYEASNTNVEINKKQTKKPSKNVSQKITIQKTTRAKKKVVTVVTGLHPYIKLEKMAKIFSKFYACGSSVIKGANNNPDQIDIQGDVEHNIVEVIMKNCPELTEDSFTILPSK